MGLLLAVDLGRHSVCRVGIARGHIVGRQLLRRLQDLFRDIELPGQLDQVVSMDRPTLDLLVQSFQGLLGGLVAVESNGVVPLYAQQTAGGFKVRVRLCYKILRFFPHGNL